METAQFRSYGLQPPVSQLKESIRDIIRLQREYTIPDELFWEVFNTRVLLNQPIDIDDFICNQYLPPAYA